MITGLQFSSDDRVRDRAPDESNLLHAGQANVSSKLAAAAQMPSVLFAENPSANTLTVDGAVRRRVIEGHADLPD